MVKFTVTSWDLKVPIGGFRGTPGLLLLTNIRIIQTIVKCLSEAKETIKHSDDLEAEVFEKLPVLRVEAVLIMNTVFAFVIDGNRSHDSSIEA